MRDVLATYTLKQTGSYERANYAMQDAVATVADHYGLLSPHDKAAFAAQDLGRQRGLTGGAGGS